MKLFFVALVAIAMALPVGHAAIADLRTEPTVVFDTAYGRAIFTTDFTKTAGTGVIQPFLTIQSDGIEKGYNTSNGVFDTKRAPQFNHELRLSDLDTININGSLYYSFLLDINESNSAPTSFISLDALSIYTSPTAGQTTTNLATLGTLRFDLDLPEDNAIIYDDANSGSGQGDIAFFLPVSIFAGVSPTDYIYMYQSFGGLFGTQGGFEETRIGKGIVPGVSVVPEVATLLPLAGFVGLVVGGRRFGRRRSAD